MQDPYEGCSPRFPSPNSELPPEALEELERCIDAANEFLLALGRAEEEDPADPNRRALQLRLRKLRGAQVRVIVQCRGTHKETISGNVEEAGRDFLQLERVGKRMFVPFKRIVKIIRLKPERDGVEERDEQELLCVDECLRRDLVLDFGRTVSCSPFLINLFFGISLSVQLVSLLGGKVRVRTDEAGAREVVQGTLTGTEEDAVLVQVGTNQMHRIKLENICSLTF